MEPTTVSSSPSSKPTTTKSSTSSTTTKTQTKTKIITEIEQDIRRIALEQVGKPYAYGGADPDSYDFSDLIYYILKTAAGITSPRTHEQQTDGKYGTTLKRRDEVKTGDVIECEKGLALYISDDEAVYSWGTVQKFEVCMVVDVLRMSDGGIKLVGIDTGSFTFTATSLNGKTASYTGIVK